MNKFFTRFISLFLATLLILETLPANASPRVSDSVLTTNSEQAYSLTEGFFDGSSSAVSHPSPLEGEGRVRGSFPPDLPSSDPTSTFSRKPDRVLVAQATGSARDDLRRRAGGCRNPPCTPDPVTTPDEPGSPTGGNTQTRIQWCDQNPVECERLREIERQEAADRNKAFNKALEGEGIAAGIMGVPAIVGGFALLFTPFAVLSIFPFAYAGLIALGLAIRGKEGADLWNAMGYAGEAVGITVGGLAASTLTTLTLGLVDTKINDPKSWRSKLFNGANTAGRVITMLGGAAVAGVAIAGLLPVPVGIAAGVGTGASAAGQGIAWLVRDFIPGKKLEGAEEENRTLRNEQRSLTIEGHRLLGESHFLLYELGIPNPPQYFEDPEVIARQRPEDESTGQLIDRVQEENRRLSQGINRVRPEVLVLRRQVNDLKDLKEHYQSVRIGYEGTAARGLSSQICDQTGTCRPNPDGRSPEYPDDAAAIQALIERDLFHAPMPFQLWAPSSATDATVTTAGFLDSTNDHNGHRGLDISAARDAAVVSRTAGRVLWAGYYNAAEASAPPERIINELKRRYPRQLRDMTRQDAANMIHSLGNAIVLQPDYSITQLLVYQHLGHKEVVLDEERQGRDPLTNLPRPPTIQWDDTNTEYKLGYGRGTIVGLDDPGSGIRVQQGDMVQPGTILGTVGNTGRMSGRAYGRGEAIGSHLHAGVIEVNPEMNVRMAWLRDGTWKANALPEERDKYGEPDDQEIMYQKIREAYFAAIGYGYDSETNQMKDRVGEPNPELTRDFIRDATKSGAENYSAAFMNPWLGRVGASNGDGQ